MDLNHLHLGSPCIEDSVAFYSYLGFMDIERHENGSFFLRNEDGFTLTIDPVDKKSQLPSWLHFGFRMEAKAEVEALYTKIKRLGYAISSEIEYFDDFIRFRCLEPAGFEVEIYWELIPA